MGGSARKIVLDIVRYCFLMLLSAIYTGHVLKFVIKDTFCNCKIIVTLLSSCSKYFFDMHLLARPVDDSSYKIDFDLGSRNESITTARMTAP